MISSSIKSVPGLSDLLKKNGFPPVFDLESLRQEASSRSYYRIVFRDRSVKPIILCKTLPIPAPDHDDFLVISKYFRDNGIPAPAIPGFDPELGLILQEDGGRSDLTSAVDHVTASSNNSPRRLKLVQSAIDLLIQIHALKPIHPVKDRSFDFEKLYWEMQFLYTHMTSALGADLTSIVPHELQIYIREMCEKLGDSTLMVFTHRDYHGRNLLIKSNDQYDNFDNAQLTVIDFQDARLGSPWYDLASLVYDPYTFISSDDRQNAVNYYNQKTGIEDIDNLFYLQALQRLLKAMGSYFFLVKEKGMSKYARYIPVVLDHIIDIQQKGDLPDMIYEFSKNVSRQLHSQRFVQ